MNKMNVAVFFGGQSTEHDISILSANQALNVISKDKYNVFPIYVARDGKWYFSQLLYDVALFKNFDSKKHKRVFLKFGEKTLYSSGIIGRKLCEIDCALVVMHGAGGEDGCLQGALELCNIPYTSGSVLSLASTLDKRQMKAVFKAKGFPIVEHRELTQNYDKEMLESLPYPVVVKPNSLGSSIAIAFCTSKEETEKAIDFALKFDSLVLVENAITNLTEYNCAALGYKNKVMHSQIEQPLTEHDILSFEDKYTSKQKQKGIANTKRLLPAMISKKLVKEITDLTEEAFKAFDCCGIVRCDFLYDGEKLYINEINSIPGSLAFYLFNKKFTLLIDNLIECAFLKQKEKDRIIRTFDSSVLK